ncbi:mycothiol system anti-sigma-R factor [Actinocrispum sp. NPDC049592]|uniref:mycothiol system anti-sigma-R factor n=1 Tax=Actinocrispum sp. NPDC049592 TaxID=3154835 RepID=UPI00341532F4
MSCGDHHDTDCSEVLNEVWLFLDGECNQERKALLQQHLDECSPCLQEYGLDEHLKALLHKKCGGEHASAEFKERLRASIRQTVISQGGVTVEVTETRVETQS